MPQLISNIAIRDGQLTPIGEALRDQIAEAVVAEAAKTDDPRGFIRDWDRRFREGMTALGTGGVQ
jgi:hypothetical protein